MKNIALFILCLVLALGVSAVSFAESQDIFKTIDGLEWSFCSGAGAWSTDMRIQADGSFTGEYHDSEMGDMKDEYPNGTVYFCNFSGQMSFVEKKDDCWILKVEKLVRKPAEESIAEGFRYVPGEACGLAEGDEMKLYAPGTPVSVLSEEMQLWAHVMDKETRPSELEFWFLMSEKNDSGFVGYRMTTIANPWVELTAEQLTADSGLSFGVPEYAENIVYRYMQSGKLAEMQFTIDFDKYCARIQPANEPADISGMYYTWENEEPVTIGGCPGTLGQAQPDSADKVELCQWYNADKGLQYALSVHTPDFDGLDLTAVAEQIMK